MQDVQWTFKCPLEIFVRPLDNGYKNVQWTFLSVQWTLWLFNRQNTVISPIRVLAIRLCPLVHLTNGHKNVQSTFLCVQWTLWLSLLPSECLPSDYVHWSTGRMYIRMSNGHFYVSSGHYGCHFCHQSACHQTMSIGRMDIRMSNGHFCVSSGDYGCSIDRIL